ncbi:MAG: transglycosylase domain-containing protein [Micrococcales bacterium]|nr:transglycosylase domain-containing protein [Micrococcales bacterium]
MRSGWKRFGKGMAKWLGGVLTVVVASVTSGLLASGFFLPAIDAASLATSDAEYLFEALPEDLQVSELAQSSYIYAADGTLLATFYFQDRTEVPLDQISPYMQHAVVALEDRRYYEHVGVDWAGMARALVSNALGTKVQGASTLTQQYVKNLLINTAVVRGDMAGALEAQEVSYQRKIREAKMAITLEKRLSKEEILEGYLNIAQFGPSQYGVESAARFYFGVHAADLTPVQAATIASTTQSPNGNDPVNHPEANQFRRDAALSRMLEMEFISQEEFDEAVAQDVQDTLNITPSPTGCASAAAFSGAAFFCDYVVAEIRSSEEFGASQRERDDLLRRGGLRITTTLDLTRQAQALEAVTGTIPIEDGSGVGMAITAVEPGTGKIVAMAQNREYGEPTDTNPRATIVNYNVDRSYGGSSGFQAGSTFKPFTLAEWLIDGHSLRDSFDASRTSYNNTRWKARCVDGGVMVQTRWSVRGAGGKSVNALTATANSINGAYAAMEYQLDLCDITDLTKSMGIERADGEDWAMTPAMVLGTNEVSPLAMAAAYATFAAGGVYCRPQSIAEVVTAAGDSLKLAGPQCQEVMDSGVAAAVSVALKGVIDHGTGTRARIYDGRDQAGKTGTTDSHVAVWFAGYTAQLAAAVWAGHPEGNVPMTSLTINGVFLGSPMGGTLPAGTWGRFMNNAMSGLEHVAFAQPPRHLVVPKTVKVPDLTGMTLEQAAKALSEAGLAVGIATEMFSDQPIGLIYLQDPLPGAEVIPEVGANMVNVLVSKGPEPPVQPPPAKPTPPPTKPPPPPAVP